jgi:MtN3 and saliva related transmembrane protein
MIQRDSGGIDARAVDRHFGHRRYDLSTFSLMPQVLRTWRTRSANDISAAWLVAAMASMMVWVGYASLINAPAVVLVNILCFLQCAYILFIKLRSERGPVAKRS